MKQTAPLTTLCAIAFVWTAAAMAHEGHDHGPLSMKGAVELALTTTTQYTHKAPPFTNQLLDESWRELPASAAKVHENGRGYYVVRIENPAVSKTLYLRILLDGTIESANFSGEFPSAN